MDKWLRNPNVVRIVALLLSILLWFVVHMEGQQNPSQTGWTERSTSKEIEQVGIEVVGLDESRYELLAIEPTQVRIRVSGLPNVLSRVTTQTARVQLDLTNAASGVQQIQLKPAGFPEQVEVEIFPEAVMVTLEEKLMREMPVDIRVTGQPAGGFVVGTPTVQPNRVYVTMRESAIDQIAAVRGTVDVSGADTLVRKQIRLFAYNEDGERMEAVLEPSVVEVEVPVTHPGRTMPLQILLTGEPAPGYSVASVEQTPLEVVVFGNEQVLSWLEFYYGGSVDIASLSTDVSVPITLPKINGVSQVEPETAQVDVRIVPATRAAVEGVRLNPSGVRPDLEAVIRDPAEGVMTVMLEGAPETLAGIGPEDIDVIVDVSGLPEGIHEVELSYSLPAFVRVVEDETPASVTVEIREPGASEADGPAVGTPDGAADDGGEDEATGDGGPSAGLPGTGVGNETAGQEKGNESEQVSHGNGNGQRDGNVPTARMRKHLGTGA